MPPTAALPDAIAPQVRAFLDCDEHLLLIDGERAAAADGRTLATLDPATESELGTVSHAGAADVDRAVRAARAALAEDAAWRKMSAADRGRRMIRLAELVEAHGDELAQIESLDNGKP